MHLRKRAGRHGSIVLLGGLTMLASVGIHMFVPAMPAAALSLGAQASQIQLALTLYLIGVACGQVATGPISDRVGRRPVLLAGALLLVGGSLLCSIASSVGVLLIGRVIQALGASAGLVAGRATVGDAGAEKGARDMALLAAISMLSPMLAPVLGSLISNVAGWRAIFVLLAIAGAGFGLAIFRWMPETWTGHATPRTNLFADWAAIVRNRGFQRNLALGTSLVGGLYVFLSASPFLFLETYSGDPRLLGVYYGIVAIGAGAGALGTNLLASRWPASRIVLTGALVAAVGALGLVWGVLAGWHSVAALVVPMMGFAFGGGIAAPNTMMAAAACSPGRVGTAVSLYGALQMAGSALTTLVVARLPSHDPLVPILGIAVLSAVALILSLYGRRVQPG